MTNRYFDNDLGVKSEQNLVEDMIIEIISISGRELYYIPRTTNNIDQLLNEQAQSSFESFSVCDMWVENWSDYGGDDTLMSKFGLTVENKLTLVCAKRRFKELVQTQPYAGDLIYDPLSKMLFQIDKVLEEATPAFQLQKLYAYTFKCSPFVYSYEPVSTGVSAIDTKLDPDTFTTIFDDSGVINDEAAAATDFSETNPFGTSVDRGT